MTKSIDDLQLSVRARNGLHNAGISTVEDLISVKTSQLLGLPNFGKVSLDEVRKAIDAHLAGDGVDDHETKEFVAWCFRHRKVLESLRRGLA